MTVDLRQWVKRSRLLCRMDLQRVESLFFGIGEWVTRDALPQGPRILTIDVPPEDWHWLAARPPAFRDAYRRGLNECLQRLVAGHFGADAGGVGVELRCAEDWGFSWGGGGAVEGGPPASPGGQACLIRPDPKGAVYLRWSHPFDPRRPTAEEGRDDPDRVQSVIDRLGSPEGERWESGESHRLCGQRWIFMRTEGGRAER